MILAEKLVAEPAKLYVVTSISNPCRYESRYKLYKNFKKMVENSGAILYTIELAYGNRQFEITENETVENIQVRSSHELWHKENLLNLAIQQLPNDWEYVAWIDADIQFARPDWVAETLQLLQHYDFIQMFSKAQDLLPNNEPMQIHTGFAYSYLNDIPFKKYYSNWHPGFAWAARRDALNKVGGLIDYAILGAADRHMAFGLIDKMDETLPIELRSTGYYQELKLWEERCRKHIKRNIGYMDGLVLHYWHGKKRDRRYQDRWKILIKNLYDPDLDLKRDTQGVYQLTERSIQLRDDIRSYFRSRNEDSIDYDDSEVKL